MNPKTAARWIEAHQKLLKMPGIPAIVTQVTEKYYRQAMRQAIPAKPRIRLPRGSRPQSIKTLKKKAWDAFSRFIRQRDADENGNCKCCTCDSIRHWKGMDAGHFESRVNESTLFDEMNVHAQCKGCNMPPNNGRRIEYAAFLDEMYGKGAAARITARSYRREMKREELEKVLTKYEGEAPPEAEPVPQKLPPTTQKGES